MSEMLSIFSGSAVPQLSRGLVGRMSLATRFLSINVSRKTCETALRQRGGSKTRYLIHVRSCSTSTSKVIDGKVTEVTSPSNQVGTLVPESAAVCETVGLIQPTNSIIGSMKHNLQCYSELSKLRLTSLVVASTVGGFLMAGYPDSLCTLGCTVLGTTLASVSANTFNQIYEIRTDGLMKRTMDRPLPSGRMTISHATAFGVSTGAAATAILYAGANPLTASLGLANILIYAGIYTPMKQLTKWNTWAGSVVGAIPPVMGWAAATGTIASPEAALLAATLFYWQFPHFFSLAWLLRKDYHAGGYKMITEGDPTGLVTSKTIQRYTAYLAVPPLLTTAVGYTSSMFAVETILLNGYFYYVSNQFVKNPNDKNARKIFLTSLWYLPVVMTLMVYHSEKWTDELPQLRTTMKDACPHEILIKDSIEVASALCPVNIMNDKATDAKNPLTKPAAMIVESV